MFDRFIAIDWSGAKAGYRGKIEIAQCLAGDAPPALLAPPDGWWRRHQVLEWLQALADEGARALIGMDFSFAPPWMDRKAYLPGLATAATAKGFWRFLDNGCEDPDLGAASFVERHRGRYFYLGAVDGDKAQFMRLRVCEQAFNATDGGKPSSVFDAIGAAQVSKASFAGMRLLARLAGRLAIWPFDPLPATGPVLVEIYCRAFIRAAGLRGLKMRDPVTLNQALRALGSRPMAAVPTPLSDDRSDALLAAAGLRYGSVQPQYWQPPGLSARVAATEGWTFGVP
ncbi:MAG: hypothetical protein Tsb0016_24670 [Sphingomonadales bacterium]